MPKLIVVDRAGDTHEIQAAVDQSVMESIRDAGVDELLAVCGGCCSCATCHVVVDDAWTETLGKAAGDEDDLLDSSSYREANSRLSCQIIMQEALCGLKVRIAQAD